MPGKKTVVIGVLLAAAGSVIGPVIGPVSASTPGYRLTRVNVHANGYRCQHAQIVGLVSTAHYLVDTECRGFRTYLKLPGHRLRRLRLRNEDLTLGSNVAADGTVAIFGYNIAREQYRSFIRRPDGTLIQLADPKAGHGGTEIGDVNAHDDAVGGYFVRGVDSKIRPFVYRNGVFRTVHVRGGHAVYVNGINSHGAIAGSFVDRHGVMHGFTRIHGKLHVINVRGAGRRRGTGTAVTDIADNGSLSGTVSASRSYGSGWVRHRGHVTVFAKHSAVGCVDTAGDAGLDTFRDKKVIGYLAAHR